MTLDHTEQSPSAVTARPRIPWRWIVVAFVALLLTTAVIAVLWLRTYAPLGDGNSWWPGPNVQRFVPAEDDPDAWLVERQTAVMDFRQNGQFRFLTSVGNDGRLPITLEGVTRREWHPGWAPIMRFDELKLGARGRSMISADEELVPFHPLTLDPGETQELMVLGTFKGTCPPPSENDQGSWHYDSVELRYSYAGVFERTQRVPLHTELVLLCGMGGGAVDDE